MTCWSLHMDVEGNALRQKKILFTQMSHQEFLGVRHSLPYCCFKTYQSLKTDRSLFGAALFICNLQQTSSPRSRTSCVSKCLFSSSPSPHHHVWSPECHSTLWTQMLCSELVLHGDSPMATEESNKVTKQMKWLGARRPRAVFTLSQLLNMHSRCMRCCGGR